MGAEPSKEIQKTYVQGNRCGPINDFPNMAIKDREIAPWSLLHQCSVDSWKQGHAEAANFQDSVFSCDRTLHKDCSSSFCMSRQGVINVDRPSSIFSFRKRTKFAKMAEHFEYNYIPAQMSSVNHFRVKSILCFRNSLVVLHLSRNGNSQFGILDLESNKFMGVFGKQPIEYANENFSGELSPDRSKCLVLKPKLFRSPNQNRLDNLTSYSQIVKTCSDPIHHCPLMSSDSGLTSHGPSNLISSSVFDEEEGSGTETVPLAELLLYDMSSKHLLSRVPIKDDFCHFSFDPRYRWRRISLMDFGHACKGNNLNLVELMAPSTPPKNIVSLPASGIMSNEDVVPSKPKNRPDITDWTWNITFVNHRLDDPWEETIIGSSQIGSSSPSSSNSSSDFSTLPKPVDLRHSRDGRLIVVTMLELGECRCREKKSICVQDQGATRGLLNLNQPYHFRGRRYQYHPNLSVMNCTLYIFDADNAKTLQCIQYHRYICQLHTCPSNYVPVFSICGTKMAVTVDAMLNVSGDPTPFSPKCEGHNLAAQVDNRKRHDSIQHHHVQVYQLPLPAFCLQALCRAVLLENRLPISKFTLPQKILHYLNFDPEFD